MSFLRQSPPNGGAGADVADAATPIQGIDRLRSGGRVLQAILRRLQGVANPPVAELTAALAARRGSVDPEAVAQAIRDGRDPTDAVALGSAAASEPIASTGAGARSGVAPRPRRIEDDLDDAAPVEEPAGRGPGSAAFAYAMAGHEQTPARPPQRGQILYVGMGDNAALELQALQRANADRGGARGVVDDKRLARLLATPGGRDGWIATLGLSPDRAAAILEILAGQTSGMDEVAQLVAVFVEAERGKTTLDRFVLSGENIGSDSGVYGKTGKMTWATLEKLALLFPAAAGQIRHLNVAACFAGVAPGQYAGVFPNLATVMSYDGSSPGAASGGVTHLQRWEKATENNPATLSRTIAQGTRKAESVSTWDRTQTSEQHSDLLKIKMAIETRRGVFDEYYDGEKEVTDPQSGPLFDLYYLLQQLANNPAAADVIEDVRTYAQMRDRVVRLRFWKKVIPRFLQEHQRVLSVGLPPMGVKWPITDRSRHNIVAINEHLLSGDKPDELPDESEDAAELWLDGAYELDPELIPESFLA